MDIDIAYYMCYILSITSITSRINVKKHSKCSKYEVVTHTIIIGGIRFVYRTRFQ